MGNRAVLAFDTFNPSAPQDSVGVYLHWNGGRDSVEAFLAATKKLMKDRGEDEQYARARLIQVIGNFLGGSLSLGLGKCSELDCDNYDNGVYVIDTKHLEIVGRYYYEGPEDNNYDREEMTREILKKMPPEYGYGEEAL